MDSNADSHVSSEQPPEPGAGAAEISAPSTVPSLEGVTATRLGAGAQSGDAEKKAEKSPKLPRIPGSSLVVLSPTKRDSESEDATASVPPKRSVWSLLARRAALALLFLGVAFAGRHFLAPATPATEQSASAVSATTAAPASASVTSPSAQGQVAQQSGNAASASVAAMREEIRSLETRVESLHMAVQNQTPNGTRDLKSSIDGLRASLEAVKAQSNNSIAELSAKIDRLEHADVAKAAPTASTVRTEHPDAKSIQATLDRAARTEHTNGPVTTGSVAPPAKPQTLAMATPEPPKKSQLLTNFVVRDVYDGIALVEGPEGAVEVMPGDTIPGAGTVKSIERRGAGWVVLTSRGTVEYPHE